MSSRVQPTTATIKILWMRSWGRCAFPECRQGLVAEATSADRDVVVGEMAHIVAHSEEAGPRSDPAFPRVAIDLPENLIVLCPTHHTLVDKQPNSYTAENLRGWKRRHEEWAKTRLQEEVLSAGATEFEQVLRFLLQPSSRPSTPVVLPTDPSTKMSKNGLTLDVRPYLEAGMLRSWDVARYVEHESILDPSFPERLRDAFRSEYDKQMHLGLRGDELFLTILDWARQGRGRQEAAVFPVITYLFESCELFEP